ncbi:MAG: winged helix-turn-helix transcriptional regulator [Ilumatobacteraceae bacterium]
MRSYDQYCPVAVALDAIGDRWTLLILRELLHGDRRFTDLRNALSGVAPNLLADRLRELEAQGLVERRELPPPAARTVYALTADGRATGPVVQALARWGASRLGPPARDPVRPSMAVLGMTAPFHRADGTPLHARVVVDGETFDLRSDGTRLSTRARPDARPDLVVTTTAKDLVAARQGRHRLTARAISGPARQRTRFLRMFELDGAMAGRRAARP